MLVSSELVLGIPVQRRKRNDPKHKTSPPRKCSKQRIRQEVMHGVSFLQEKPGSPITQGNGTQSLKEPDTRAQLFTKLGLFTLGLFLWFILFLKTLLKA